MVSNSYHIEKLVAVSFLDESTEKKLLVSYQGRLEQ